MALTLASASINLILSRQEKSRFVPYGQRVSVDCGSMNVWRNGHAGPTMVLLSGLGTAAPALDFAPLIRQLGAYNVVVVEGFGYGYSDMSARPRTVQNITAEVHDTLAKLGAPKPYILVGHSIAGFYTLAYAHRYPQEVSAVVGIDPTMPAAKAGPAGTSGLPFHAVGTVLAATGLVRAAKPTENKRLAPRPWDVAERVGRTRRGHRLAVRVGLTLLEGRRPSQDANSSWSVGSSGRSPCSSLLSMRTRVPRERGTSSKLSIIAFIR